MPILLGCGSLSTIAMAQTEHPLQRRSRPATRSDFLLRSLNMIQTPKIVTAKGDVIASREGYSVRADNIVWNRTTGQVLAEGNIRAVGPDGDVRLWR